MKGKIITHKDGTESFVMGDIQIIKAKETVEDQKEKKVKVKDIEDVEFDKKGKAKIKSKD